MDGNHGRDRDWYNVGQMDTSSPTLYRFYDAADRPLYYGATGHTWTRMNHHRMTTRWFREAVTVKLEHFDTWPAALKAEGEWIARDNPKYNVRGVNDSFRTDRSAARAAQHPFPAQKWITTARRQLGWSITRLAGEVGSSVGYMRKIEVGERRLTDEMAKAVGRALAVPAPRCEPNKMRRKA